jgi:hypothetical protein
MTIVEQPEQLGPRQLGSGLVLDIPGRDRQPAAGASTDGV